MISFLDLNKDYLATLADPGGGARSPPDPPDLEAPVIQFGGPVYNLRAKQWILGPFFILFQKHF